MCLFFCLYKIVVVFITFSLILWAKKVRGEDISKNRKNRFFSTSTIFFTLLLQKDKLGQKFTQRKKYVNITKFGGIYWKLTSQALSNWYKFSSWLWTHHKNGKQKMVRRFSGQLFRVFLANNICYAFFAGVCTFFL